MAGKGIKRSFSQAKKAGGAVAKKCKTIASTIKNAEEVPVPVRAMLCDMLGRTFNTYKAERHAFQNNASALVGGILKTEQGKLQTAIKEAQTKKAALDAEAANLSAASNAAGAASEAAANVSADSKTAVTDSKTALKDAKAALHDLEAEVKTAAHDAAAATVKKEKLDAVANDYPAAVGRHVCKELGNSLEPEFLTCVNRTFGKQSASWGTFDHIVVQRLQENLKKLLAGLNSEIEQMAAATGPRAANVENAKGAIGAAEDKFQVMGQACLDAGNAAKEAEAAAKTASTGFKQHQHHADKATSGLTDAEDALTKFTNGALAAYTEIEARVAPAPKQEEPAPSAEAAMAPAPPAASAGVMGMVRNLLPSPRLLSSPVVQQSAPAAVASSPRRQSAVASSPRRQSTTPAVASSPRQAVASSPREFPTI